MKRRRSSANSTSRRDDSLRVARHIVLDGRHMPIETPAEIRKASAAMRAIRVHTSMVHYGPLGATPDITRTGTMFEAVAGPRKAPTKTSKRRTPEWDGEIQHWAPAATVDRERSNPRRPTWDEQEKLYGLLRNSSHGDVLHIRGATVLNVPEYSDGFTINGGAIMSADRAASALAAMPREKKPVRRIPGRR